MSGEAITGPPRSLFSLSGVKAFRATREELRRARHLPGYVYTSREFEEYEKDRIFMRDWLCIGRVEELPNHGDYMTLRIMGEPVLVARDGKGRLAAFSNVCRHRGVEVAQGAGNAREFRCPYHGWTYDLRGVLKAAPEMSDSAAELGNCRLPMLRAEVYRGWLFLSFDPDAPPLAATLADFDREFGWLRPEDCVLADKTVIDLDCNWKFAVEHLMDLYHLRAAHAEGLAPPCRGNQDRAVKLLPRGGYSLHFEAAPSAKNGLSPFGKMPWLMDRPDGLACLGFLAPNLNFAARVDAIRHLVSWPLAPDRSRLICYTLLPAEVFGKPGFAAMLGAYANCLRRAVEEDRAVMQSLQNGVSSRHFEPGPLSSLEGPAHHVINNYLDAMTA